MRLEDFLVEAALQHGDFDLPRRAVDAIRAEFRILETNPFTCRIADDDRLETERCKKLLNDRRDSQHFLREVSFVARREKFVAKRRHAVVPSGCRHAAGA